MHLWPMHALWAICVFDLTSQSDASLEHWPSGSPRSRIQLSHHHWKKTMEKVYSPGWFMVVNGQNSSLIRTDVKTTVPRCFGLLLLTSLVSNRPASFQTKPAVSSSEKAFHSSGFGSFGHWNRRNTTVRLLNKQTSANPQCPLTLRGAPGVAVR